MRTVKEIAEDVLGTCKSDPDELEKMTMEELEEFDSIAMKCCECGWWVDPNDMSDKEDEPVCNECFEG